MSKKKYFQLVENADRTAELYIYGYITSWPWQESDVSSYTLSRALQSVCADQITVYINSYGGEVAEATAIYNQLRNHRARIVTVCDGFACSAASVIFMAGDERWMNRASRLMIHNAMSKASGNAQELRKAADDLENINELSITAYLECINIPREALQTLMDSETWIAPEDAVRMGFATGIVAHGESNTPQQSALSLVLQALDGQKPTTVQTFLNTLSQRGKE